jgi:nucleoside recognition membrane protein YjiH
MQEKDDQANQVTWVGYAAFIFAIVFFSGIFSSSQGWFQAFDFTVLNGSFGKIQGAQSAFTFRGVGGSGARDGFIFSLELMPAVILALGVVSVIDGLGGLRAAQKLMTPILKPLLGIPGICALASIANMQSTDAAAGMIKELKENDQISDEERSIAIAYQTSASAFITNYFSSGAAVFSFMLVPMIVPVAVMLIFKVVGANLMRLYIKLLQKKAIVGGHDHGSK